MAAALTPLKVAIVGGSIGGLAAANAFHRLGATVRVFEKSPTRFSGRGGSIGFCQVPLWEQLRNAPMIRRGQRASRAQGGWVYGTLWDFLESGLPAGAIAYDREITDLGEDPARPTIDGEVYDLAVVADGGWSALRGRYFEATRPVYAGYEVHRFRVPAANVPGFRAYGDYSNGHFYTILLDIVDEHTDYIMGGTSIPKPEAAVARPGGGANRQTGGLEPAGGEDAATRDFLAFYRETFGGVAGGELVRVMAAAAAHGKITGMAQFEFAARSVVAGRVVLVGDAAHMASPRTAAGAHTAVLDGLALFEAFGEALAGGPRASAVDRALARYAPLGAARARQLVERSRQVSADVVPRGWARGEQVYVRAAVGGTARAEL